MTRNNLADNLSWLSQNPALSKPTTPSFPRAIEASLSGLSQSQHSDSSGPRHNVPRLHTNPREGGSHENSTLSGINGSGKPSAPSRVSQLVTAGEEAMGRLASTTKPKKPSLVSKQNLLLTPASTTGNARSNQAGTQGRNGTGKNDRQLQPSRSDLTPHRCSKSVEATESCLVRQGQSHTASSAAQEKSRYPRL